MTSTLLANAETVRVLRGRGDSLDADRAVTGATLDQTADSGVPAVRAWTPHRQVAFGRRDAASEGYDRAVAAARERGFEPVEREVGGRAVAYTGTTVAFAHAVPVEDPRVGIDDRYATATTRVRRALAEVGVDADPGEFPFARNDAEDGDPAAFEERHGLLFEVVLACTGLGSMAIFAGLIAAVRAPLGRKLRALAVSIPIIWLLNIARTTFIGITFGNQYLQLFVDEVLFLFGGTDPYKVSFYLSDRVISQVLAVVALIGVTYLVVRELPELLTVVEDVLYIVTREEYDLREALDLPEREDVGPGAD